MNRDGAVFGPPLEITFVSFCHYNDLYMIFDQHNEFVYDFYMVFDQKQRIFHKVNNLEFKELQSHRKKAPAAAF